MGTKLRPPPEAIALAVAVLLAAFWFKVPLPLIVLGAAPLGIWFAIRRVRR
jgi:hypothetical protein